MVINTLKAKSKQNMADNQYLHDFAKYGYLFFFTC